MDNIILNHKDLIDLANASYDIFILSERGNDHFLMVNKRASEILGYSEEELLSKPFYEFILPEDVEKTRREAKKLDDGLECHSFINRYRTKEGNVVHLRWNSAEIKGKFYNFAQLEEDIDKMRLSDDNFSQLFQNSGTVICIIDLNGHFIDVSPSGESFWGYTRQEMLNCRCEDVTHPHDLEQSMNEIKKLSDKSNKKGHFQLKKRFIHKNGHVVYGIVDAVLMLDINKGPAYIVVQIQDVSNLVRAEKHIEAINKQLLIKNENLESFAYAASHDLQEPLRKISAFSSIIKRQISDQCGKCQLKEDLYVNLDSLISASKRMGRLIDDLLEYSRVGRFDFNLEAVDMNEVIEEVRDFLSLAIAEKGVQLEVSDIPVVCANKTRMIQLMQNLIGNSIKFSKKGVPPVIKIGLVKRIGSQITFCIEDNGVGFSMDFSEKIFRPFERLYGREDYEGSGMGLALCKSIVDNLGGEIWAESVEGQGSKFFVTLSDKGCKLHGTNQALDHSSG